jgi:hypothetical protein
MLKTLQAKHIPDLPILEFLLERYQRRDSGGGAVICTGAIWGDKRIAFAMPIGTPYKVKLAKMRALIRGTLSTAARADAAAISKSPTRASNSCIPVTLTGNMKHPSRSSGSSNSATW